MELKNRSLFPENELWDLTALYKDRQDFLLAIEKALEDVKQFKLDNVQPLFGTQFLMGQLISSLNHRHHQWKLEG